MTDLQLISDAPPKKWTERAVLDALHQRLCRLDQGMTSRRYVVAEHARLDPMWARHILDMVAGGTWRSSGFALDGYEVKTSRSDLRRELNDLSKSQAFEEHLDTFSIVAPSKVLANWRDMSFPAHWGVMVVTDEGATRWLRKPTGTPGYNGLDRPMKRAVFAAIARSAANTAERHCALHGSFGGAS